MFRKITNKKLIKNQKVNTVYTVRQNTLKRHCNTDHKINKQYAKNSNDVDNEPGMERYRGIN